MSQAYDFRTSYHSSSACLNGRLQSPIDLVQYDSSFNPKFQLYTDSYSVINNARVIFNGIHLSVSQTQNLLNNFGYASYIKNGVAKQYILKNIEVHFPGEHQIEGQQPDVEIMFIHEKNLGYQSSMNHFRQIPDSNLFLIVSILYKRSSTLTDNGFLKDLLSTVSGYTSNNNFNYRTDFSLDIDSYDILGSKAVYFYDGSFTYTPCDETVNRVVYRDMYSISSNDYQFLSQIYQSVYTNGVTNKAIAKVYGRNITRNFMNYTEAASAGYLNMKLVNALFIAVVCLFLI
jgi:carbonic anhydrase